MFDFLLLTSTVQYITVDRVLEIRLLAKPSPGLCKEDIKAKSKYIHFFKGITINKLTQTFELTHMHVSFYILVHSDKRVRSKQY